VFSFNWRILATWPGKKRKRKKKGEGAKGTNGLFFFPFFNLIFLI
jgi:hypothetical protein